MSHLLDTSALLTHLRKEPGWERVQAIFESSEAEVLVSAVSVTELGRRLRTLGAAQQEIEATLDAYLSILRVVAVDTQVARWAIELAASASGGLPLADALIAACAITSSACLVHRDAHMSAIPRTVLPQVDLAGE